MKPKDVHTKDSVVKKNKVNPTKNSKDSRYKREISRKYKFGSTVLGMGMYGKVFLAENKNDPT